MSCKGTKILGEKVFSTEYFLLFIEKNLYEIIRNNINPVVS